MTDRELRRIKSRAEEARRIWQSEPCPVVVVRVAELVPQLVEEIELLQNKLKEATKVDDIQDLYW